MAFYLTCTCRYRFSVPDEEAGYQVLCPACGQLLRATPDADARAGVVPEDDVVIPVIPVVEEAVAELEPELVPEVEVEEVSTPAWFKSKKSAARWDDNPEMDTPPKPAKGGDPSKTVKASVFASNLASHGERTWGMIGTIPLQERPSFVAFNGIGSWALAGQGNRVAVLHMQRGTVFHDMAGHVADVTCVALSCDGEMAISGDERGTIHNWSLQTFLPRYDIAYHRSAIQTLAFSPNGELAASGDSDGVVRLWEAYAGARRNLADARWSERITALAFSGDNTRLIAGGEQGLIQVWSVRTGKCMARFRPERATVQSVRIAANGLNLFAALTPASAWSACYPNIVRFDLKTGDEIACFLPGEPAKIGPEFVTLDHRCRRVLIAGSTRAPRSSVPGNSHLEIWDLSSSKPLHTFADLDSDALGIAIARSDNAVVLPIRDDGVQLFVMPAGEAPTVRKATTDERRRRHDAPDG
jgi:hypothetical protein